MGGLGEEEGALLREAARHYRAALLADPRCEKREEERGEGVCERARESAREGESGTLSKPLGERRCGTIALHFSPIRGDRFPPLTPKPDTIDDQYFGPWPAVCGFRVGKKIGDSHHGTAYTYAASRVWGRRRAGCCGRQRGIITPRSSLTRGAPKSEEAGRRGERGSGERVCV